MQQINQRETSRILIIDDNSAIHQDIRKILGGDNGQSAELNEVAAALFGQQVPRRAAVTPAYQIDSAYQGREGLDKVKQAIEEQCPYALAFVDMRMPPGWDGVETIQHLWQVDPELQVVICTAFSDYSWSEIVEQLGQTDRLMILKKPFDTVEINQLALAMTEKWHLARIARLKRSEMESLIEQRTAELRREIAERKRAEEELREKDDQLRQKQKLEAIGSLAGGIAHEFNNLLQAIQGYTRFAMDQLEPESEPYQDLDQVMAASKRAAVLTSQLLNFSRRQPAQRTQVDLTAIVREGIRMLRPFLGEQIELELDIDHGPLPVLADPTLMDQVLMNLCINARDAMGGHGKLTIKTSTVTLPDRRGTGTRPAVDLKPGRYGLLSISDTGCGMTPDVQQRIFDPFFTTKEVGRGTGLGLAMVYGAIQQHDGTILVHSAPGEGSTFSIYLPLDETAQPDEPAPTAQEPAGRGQWILVAEDEQVVRDVLVRTLEQAGYRTVAAENGRQAVELFTQQPQRFSLVLLDVVMPEMNGHEAWQAIRQINPSVPAMMCTGYDPQDNPVARTSGLPVIGKPYQRQELLQTIRRVLDEAIQPADATVAAEEAEETVAVG